MQILYFGKLSDVTGKSDEITDLPDNIETSYDLRQWLEVRFDQPGIFLEPTTRIAMDGVLLSEPFDIADPSEIALMPPVGGG